MTKDALSGGMLTLCSSMMVFAQTAETELVSPSAIQDNSFIVEEAFNQESGVVQHIFNLVHFNKPQEDFVFTFTQEWPIFSSLHQMSFTIPHAFLNSNAINGFGDVLINYRYQLLTQDQWAAAAPRLSIILPTGNSDKGIGTGVVGLQVNVPVSKRLSESLIMHFNAGATLLPGVRSTDALSSRMNHTLIAYNLASSIVWLAHSNYNILLEYAESFLNEIDEHGNVISFTDVSLNPGLRFAVNIPALQIVPGVSMPINISRGNTRVGTFLYLSFEHPF